MAVAVGGAPGHLELLEERAAIETSRQRIPRREKLQLLVLILYLHANRIELPDHLLELGVLLLDGGHVIEGRHGSAELAIATENWCGVHDERSGLVLPPELELDALHRASFARGV